MIVSAWNVRGLNESVRQHEINTFLLRNKVTITGLLETRVKEVSSARVLNKFGRFRAINNYSAHYNGRIWVLWQEAFLDVTILQVAAQLIHLKFFCKLLNVSVYVTFVYGFNDGVARRQLWHDVMGLAPLVDLGWLVLGDFNIHFQGGPFTWMNNQDGVARGWSKLDWAFVNPLWLQSFPDSVMHILPPGTSDHSPLLVRLGVQASSPKSFQFLNCWIDNVQFLELVSSAWDVLVRGTPVFRLFAKLKKVKHSLGQLHREFYSNLSTRVTQCYSDLLADQAALLGSPMDSILMEKVTVLKQKLCVLKRAEISMLEQRAKITPLKLADSNTAYFYAAVAARRHLSVVGTIVDHHGRACSTSSSVADAFCNYYLSLLGTPSSVAPLKIADIQSGYCLTRDVSDPLDAPISSDEIRAALFSMGSNKSPGVDGFSVEFFKASWNVVSRDFCAAVFDFFKHGKLLRYASTTVITLIPKKASACSVLDYRPISCCTVFYKDDLWSSWISSYALRQHSVWTVPSKQFDAECWRSILKVRDYIFEHTGFVVADAECLVKSWVKGANFDTSAAYHFFRNVQPRFYGAKALWATVNGPKYCVTAVLAVQNKLSTIDNIFARGIVLVNRCILCKSSLESAGHLFFECDYSSYVWHHVLVWMGFTRRTWALSREFDWVVKQVQRRHWRSQWLQEEINDIWYGSGGECPSEMNDLWYGSGGECPSETNDIWYGSGGECPFEIDDIYSTEVVANALPRYYDKRYGSSDECSFEMYDIRYGSSDECATETICDIRRRRVCVVITIAFLCSCLLCTCVSFPPFYELMM
ncbi:hypothetical protein RND81_04G049800 [Saponaria officinalis]|uniref:Reverse transcriptase zinc-binding domain-containing protein n=1 Tax=Saponaria officinalis TaxID=3572 RepID=A0AAW1LHZ7_SAPOF